MAEKHAPIYVSGSGYLISGGAIECLYQEALATKLIHLEDFFLTGVVAKKACGNKLKIVSHRYAHLNAEKFLPAAQRLSLIVP